MKPTIPLPPKEYLLRLLSYDVESGKLFWKKRDVSMFRGGVYAPERRCRRWNARYAGREAFTTTNGNGYRIGMIDGRTYQAHRVIWKMVHGYDPVEVDHEDQVGTRNVLGNLRDVAPSINCRNRGPSPRNSSGRTGVARRGNRWAAQIKIDQRVIYLGTFDTMDQAVQARRSAEQANGFTELHGVRA